MQGSPAEIQIRTSWCLIGRSLTTPPCVIAQQYSSATFVSLRFHSRYQKFGALLKSVGIPFVFCNCLSLKLHNVKSRFVGERRYTITGQQKLMLLFFIRKTPCQSLCHAAGSSQDLHTGKCLENKHV
jgi:hypothetical protein